MKTRPEYREPTEEGKPKKEMPQLVRITGHSDVADTVEFAMQIAGKAQVTNAQNARTYYDRGIARKSAIHCRFGHNGSAQRSATSFWIERDTR